jgi:hypothetical protein
MPSTPLVVKDADSGYAERHLPSTLGVCLTGNGDLADAMFALLGPPSMGREGHSTP